MLGTILIFVLAALAGVFFAQSSLLDRNKETPKDELLTAKDKATIMIMGVDERSDDVGRSDTLMVATIDPQKNEASLLSIPRDTRVAIPKNGYDKINAAYAYGGEKLTQRTVEDFLGIRMDHYVIINTHAFQKIIDAIGGIRGTTTAASSSTCARDASTWTARRPSPTSATATRRATSAASNASRNSCARALTL